MSAIVQFNSKEEFISFLNERYPTSFVTEILNAKDFINGNIYNTYFVIIGNNYKFEIKKADIVYNKYFRSK
jgi:hypothetical protein